MLEQPWKYWCEAILNPEVWERNIHEHRYLIFQLVNQGSHIWESHIWELDKTRLYETAVCCRNKALVVIGQAMVCAEKMGHPLEENNASGPAFSGTLMYWNHEKSCIILNLNWMNYVLSSREDSNLYIMYINSQQCFLLAHVYDVYVNIRYHLTRFAFMLPLEALVGGQSCLQSSSL